MYAMDFCLQQPPKLKVRGINQKSGTPQRSVAAITTQTYCTEGSRVNGVRERFAKPRQHNRSCLFWRRENATSLLAGKYLYERRVPEKS
jgi:hypothetical protein